MKNNTYLLVLLGIGLLLGACGKSSPPLAIELAEAYITEDGHLAYTLSMDENTKDLSKIEIFWSVTDSGDAFFNGYHGLGNTINQKKSIVPEINFNTGYTYEVGCAATLIDGTFVESAKRIKIKGVLDSTAFAIDRQGTLYPFKKFGNATWFTRSLRTTTFNNGITIRKDPYTWMITQYDAHYDENNWNDNNNRHGLFYNYIVVGNTRNVCPVGWKIPSDGDWQELEAHFNMPSDELVLMGSNVRRGCSIRFSEFMADYSYTNGPFIRSGFNVIFQGERLPSRVDVIEFRTTFYSSTKMGTDNGYIGRRFFNSDWPCGNERIVINGNNGSQIRCIKSN
jgi:uncharacterized protein (TIGR02145 family)